MRDLGTVVRGIRTPIIKEGDDLAGIVVESIVNASKNNNFDSNSKKHVPLVYVVSLILSSRHLQGMGDIVDDKVW